MNWQEKKKREIQRLETTFHFTEAMEGLVRDILLQHERNHHLFLKGEVPLPVLLRIIAWLEEGLPAGRDLDALWVLESVEDPDGLFSGLKTRLFNKTEKVISRLGEPEFLYKWAYICFVRGEMEIVARLFLENRLAEDDFRVQLLKARLAMAAGELETAMNILAPLTEVFSEAIHQRAGLFWRMELMDAANRDFLQLLGMRHGPALKDVTKFFLATENPARALQAAQLLPGLKRNEPISRILLGAALIASGSYDEGVHELLTTQNEIWVRAFPAKYETDFRILQEFLRKGLFMLGVESGKRDLLQSMMQHPEFSPDQTPGFLKPALKNNQESGHLADVYFLSQALRAQDPGPVYHAYQKALKQAGDPRYSVFDWQNQLPEPDEPEALPEGFPERDRILRNWFGFIPANARFALGLPVEIGFAPETIPVSPGFSPWTWTIKSIEISSEEDVPLVSFADLFVRQFPQLTSVSLQNIEFSGDLARKISANAGFQQLKSFSLIACDVAYGAILTLLDTPKFQPETLILRHLEITPPLSTYPTLSQLLHKNPGLHGIRNLVLEDCLTHTQAMEYLSQIPFSRLESLSLAFNEFQPEMVEALLKAPWLKKLKRLNISFTGIEFELVKALLGKPKLHSLESLIAESESEEEAWEKLRKHKNWGTIEEMIV